MPARLATFILLLIVGWCLMATVHELGHLLCGWASGAQLLQAELRPWRLPYSLFSPDPYPLITLWGGPLIGIAVPVLLAVLIRRNWSWFLADFCLLANGLYLAVGWFSGDAHLDTTQLLRHGAPPVIILLYCAVTLGCGYVGFRKLCVRHFADRRRSPNTG